MYESMTYESIMKKMLERVPNSLDKREGSIIFDALAPAAAELAQLYAAMDVVLDQTFADTATFEYLDKRCAERGIYRKEATCAVVLGKIIPENLDVIGKRFSCEIYNYVAANSTEKAGVYEFICETAGTAPNAVIGRMVPIEYIAGLQSAEIIEIKEAGIAKEDDERLRERYFENIKGQAFGGNIADYKQKTKAIEGVGSVKVTPVWNGGGTVKLTILGFDSGTGRYYVPDSIPETAEEKADNDGLLVKVKEEIDPVNAQGEGRGYAPIGHVVTVMPPEAVNITVSVKLSFVSEAAEDGGKMEKAKASVNTAVEDYFQDLLKAWENSSQTVISVYGISQAIFSTGWVTGIEDISLNGEQNIIIDTLQVPMLAGEVVYGT